MNYKFSMSLEVNILLWEVGWDPTLLQDFPVCICSAPGPEEQGSGAVCSSPHRLRSATCCLLPCLPGSTSQPPPSRSQCWTPAETRFLLSEQQGLHPKTKKGPRNAERWGENLLLLAGCSPHQPHHSSGSGRTRLHLAGIGAGLGEKELRRQELAAQSPWGLETTGAGAGVSPGSTRKQESSTPLIPAGCSWPSPVRGGQGKVVGWVAVEGQ